MGEHIERCAIAQHIDIIENRFLLFETQRHLAAQHLQEHVHCIPLLQLTGREHGRLAAIDAIALVALPEIQLRFPIELRYDAELGDVIDTRVQLHRINAGAVALQNEEMSLETRDPRW